MAKLYLVTGPAGVGKSTITKILAEKLNKCAIVEGDDIYNQVVGGQKPWLEGNHLEVMWKNVIALIKNYLDAGIDVVFNYIIYKNRLNQLIGALAKYEIHFVVLTASAESIAKRDESRDADVQVHRVGVHLKGFAEQGYDESLFLNSENIDIESEADEILSGKFKIQAGVDDNHIIGEQKTFFDMIVAGSKIYEIRLNGENEKLVNIGDDCVFALEPEHNMMIRKKIKNKQIFKSFNEACEKINFNLVGFSSKDEMKLVYNTIYSKEKQEKMGVVAFELEDSNE